MRIDHWLKENVQLLSNNGVATSRLDCLILLEDETGKDRAWLLSTPEFELTAQSLDMLDSQINQRLVHKPLAYIRGKSEFYGLEFLINEHTLQPRPETEMIIETLKLFSEEVSSVVDIGTGSGCIAISVKAELPKMKVYGTDMSRKALETAKLNAKILKQDVEFFLGNLIEPVLGAVNSKFAVLANLPYVPVNFEINDAAKWEPKIALFGGDDGLDIYREFFSQLESLAEKPGVVITESFPSQQNQLEEFGKKASYKSVMARDFVQVFRLA